MTPEEKGIKRLNQLHKEIVEATPEYPRNHINSAKIVIHETLKIICFRYDRPNIITALRELADEIEKRGTV